MLTLFSKYKLYLIGALLGAIGGYTYWYFWGCANGCSITSCPLNSSAYWSFFGALILGSFKNKKENNTNGGE
jgi:hypothetical protein